VVQKFLNDWEELKKEYGKSISEKFKKPELLKELEETKNSQKAEF